MLHRFFAYYRSHRTALVVAHRLAPIQNADYIVVVDENDVDELGRHNDLVKASDLYQRLYETQYNR